MDWNASISVFVRIMQCLSSLLAQANVLSSLCSSRLSNLTSATIATEWTSTAYFLIQPVATSCRGVAAGAEHHS